MFKFGMGYGAVLGIAAAHGGPGRAGHSSAVEGGGVAWYGSGQTSRDRVLQSGIPWGQLGPSWLQGGSRWFSR
jgi:hypothetical protein